MTSSAVPGPTRRGLLGAGAGAAGLLALSAAPARAADQLQDGLASDRPLGTLEVVHTFTGPMPTGVTVSASGRVFVCYPKWGDAVRFTVAEIRGGREVAYPDLATNTPSGKGDRTAFVSVQSVVVDPLDRLWVVDAASPLFSPTVLGGPKLVCIDLATDRVVQTIVLPRTVAYATSYLNDVRFDLSRGRAGHAIVTDSSSTGPNAVIVVDLVTGDSWRRLDNHPSTKAVPGFLAVVEGRPLLNRPAGGPATPLGLGADGIAISRTGERLYYCPLASRQLYSVSVNALVDRTRSDQDVAATVQDEGDKGTGSDGLESDDEGRTYLTSYEHDAVLSRLPDGTITTLVHDPRLLWPDTLSLAPDGHLYITANQLHRQPSYHRGKDLRVKPYVLFRTPVDAGPVRLVRS